MSGADSDEDFELVVWTEERFESVQEDEASEFDIEPNEGKNWIKIITKFCLLIG